MRKMYSTDVYLLFLSISGWFEEVKCKCQDKIIVPSGERERLLTLGKNQRREGVVGGMGHTPSPSVANAG